ncbi:MAG: TraR/DksA family transcriptional regulator [Deltaproteobacteria bacterium]|nr:TraR/DksA family transcriptional regulator [Deltaproteobacteria bacterium]
MAEESRKRQQRIKKELLEKKRKKWVDLREEYFKKLGRDYSEQFDIPQDMEDLSLVDLIEDTGIRIADIHKEELIRIDEALKKLDDGTYGICDGCGEDIESARLSVMPITSLCVKCQAKKESTRA